VADAYKEITNWAGGVISSMPPDQIPDDAIPLGINTAFVQVGGGRTAFGSRPGLQTVNTSAFSSSPVVHFQHPYSYNTGTGYTNYLATCTDDGKLYFKNSDDTYTSALAPPTNFPTPASLCFTAGSAPVDGAVFSNRLFLLNDASERRSLVNQTYVPWGLSPIATWATADNGMHGGNSMPNETYDVTITSYHSTTGGESSSSTTKAVTLASSNHRVEVTITPTSAESAQYTHWRVYIRRQTTQAQLYQVLSFEDSGGTSIVTNGNIPIATTAVYIDYSAAQLAALTTVAPSTTENNPPPSTAQHVTAYGRRLIVCDGQNLYWSKQDRPDNFDTRSYEPINTGEGDEIRALHPFSDELLLVFLNTAVWGVYGNDPQNWVVKPIDLTVGITTHNSMVNFEGVVAWWDEASGPVVYDGTTISRIGISQLGADAVVTNLNQSRRKYIWAGHDPVNFRVIWALSAAGSTVNNQLIPYNYELKRFEASYWQTIDAASLCTGFSSDGVQRLFLGGYYGQVFYFDRLASTDGVPSGTTSGTFLPTGTSVSSITGTGFYNTDSKLVGRYVVVTDGDQRPIARTRISSNTSTTLTLATSVTGLNLSTTYSYYIGGPDFRLYGKWIDHEQPFLRKRFDRLYYHMGSSSGVSDAYITTQLEFNEGASQVIPSGIEGESLWDEAQWDVAQWTASSTLKRRLAIGRNATALRPVFYCFAPGRDIILYKVALLSRLLSDRYYG
jgi:hypothetical protein